MLSALAPSYEKIIAVTGTNGKTTTSNLLVHILRFSGISAASNSEGANMLSGVATALIKDCTLGGVARSPVAILEVDEGSVGGIFPSTKPGLVIVTNYFCDQMDRYGSLDHNVTLLRQSLDGLPRTALLLNADDPLVVTAGRGRSAVKHYGIKGKRLDREANGGGNTREGQHCPDCGEPLVYYYYHYGQLGDYYCPQCTFRRPTPDFLVTDVQDEDFLKFSLCFFEEEKEGEHGAVCSYKKVTRLQAPLRGFYNIYNILAASAAAITMGVSNDIIATTIQKYAPATGRMEEFLFQDRSCTLALIKNAAGVNEVMKTILRKEGEKALVIAINDMPADGRDVSWLWDADFSMLDHPSIKKIICSGRRAGDIAVRLKYAGVPLVKLVLEPGCRGSLEILGVQGAEEYFVLASYSTLYNYAKLLKKRRGR